MEHSRPLEDTLAKQLNKLCKGDGVHRDNLLDWIDPHVHHWLGIPERATSQSATAAVSERLREVTSHIRTEENRTIALYCLNLTGDPRIERLKLVDRQQALADARGPSRRKSVNRMKEVIIPEMVRMILAEAQ